MKRVVTFLCCIGFCILTKAQTSELKLSYSDSVHNTDILPVISIEDAVVTEGNSGGCYMVLSLSLSKRSKDPVKVFYQTSSSTEHDGDDYLQKNGIITFPSNRLLQTVRIQVDCDVHSKLDKTFNIKLTGAVNAIADHVTASGTINSATSQQLVGLHKTF